MNPVPSPVHFGIAGILTCVSFLFGVAYLMAGLAIPFLHPSPAVLAFLAVAAVAILYSMEQSIRTIGAGVGDGWALLMGDCFYAVVLAPVATAHMMLAIEK
jgi:hypothetical protein